MVHNLAIGITLALALAVTAAPTARATDQTILGNQLVVQNPSTPDKRKIVGSGRENASPNVIVGDPVATGGVLTVTANGGSSSSQTYPLPQGTSAITGQPFWSGDALKGFKYKDPKGENGPVKSVQIKRASGGTPPRHGRTFGLKALVDGKLGSIIVLPPDPGSDGCMLLGLNGGDTYSVQFGPGSQITNTGATLFKAKKPTAEGTCVTTTTTTTTLPPCGAAGDSSCGGSCPAGQTCQVVITSADAVCGFGCTCVPEDGVCTGCSLGPCPPSEVCFALYAGACGGGGVCYTGYCSSFSSF